MRSEEFAAGQPADDLSEDQKRVIDFAKRQYRYPGKQEEDMLQTFGYRGTTFFRKLNDLLDHPKALEYDPVTINRYRRIRESRMAARRTPEDQRNLGGFE